MKTASIIKSITLATVLGAVLSAAALAQMGAGPSNGRGMGGGQGAGPGAGPGAGQMAGPAAGTQGMRGMRMGQTNTPGWTLMTPTERTEAQNRMREVKTYEECVQVQAEHRTTLATRAAEKGVTLNTPKQNYCDVAKARGLLK